MSTSHTLIKATSSITLACSLIFSLLFTQPQTADAQDGNTREETPSEAPTKRLEELLRSKGFIVLIRDSSDPNYAPLLNVNATYIDSNSNGLIDSGDRGFFNPASTIKVMIAGQILEALHKNNWQRNATYKASTSDKTYNFAKDIEAMLVISDNAATNRLMTFLGFKNIGARAKQLGLSNFELNRLMMSTGPAVASPSYIVVNSGITYSVPAKNAPESSTFIRCRETSTVKGNCATADDLVMSLRLLLDEADNGGLDIAAEDRQWVAGVMSSTPKQRGFDEPDEYCRFLQPLTRDSTVGITKLISKCGVAPFSPTYLDLSRVTTKNKKSYDILVAKRYNTSVSEEVVVRDFSNVIREVLSHLK